MNTLIMQNFTFTKSLLYAEKLKNKDINVIICEDDEMTKNLLGKSLSNLGVKSINFFNTTNDLYDCLKNMKKIDKNTLIILDIKMPEGCIQGDDLCRKLRKENVKCKIIASTGMKTKTYDVSHYIEDDGFDDVLFKPYSRNDLIETLNNNID